MRGGEGRGQDRGESDTLFEHTDAVMFLLVH